LISQEIIITNDIDSEVLKIKEKSDHRVVLIRVDDFKLDHAKSAIKEAYLTSDSIKYIVCAANRFNSISQNALLKVLEEPPKNIIFILITNSKSSLLPTIKSRMSIRSHNSKHHKKTISIDINTLDLESVYTFLQANQRLDKNEGIYIVEALLMQAYESKISLDASKLDLFSSSIKLLNLNSRASTVLSNLLISLISIK